MFYYINEETGEPLSNEDRLNKAKGCLLCGARSFTWYHSVGGDPDDEEEGAQCNDCGCCYPVMTQQEVL